MASVHILHKIRNDALRLLISPLVLPILELSALYGLLRPNDGRKMYASVEATFYEIAILSGCFQPNPTYHTFGGNIDDPNAW